MDDIYFLSTDDLKWILAWVIGMNGEVQEVGSKLIFRTERYHSVSLEVSTQTIETLAAELRVVTLLSISRDPVQLAELLATIAIVVSRAGPRVKGPAAGLADKLGAEFAIASAVYLARTRSYVIQFNKLPWYEIFAALYKPDKHALTQIFQEALGLARFSNAIGPEIPVAASSRSDGEPDRIISYFEEQFGDGYPALETLIPEHDRELSSESYSNLLSVAEMEGWDRETILALIDEFRYPTLDPDLVYHNVTISGSDWRRLYIWLRQSFGSML